MLRGRGFYSKLDKDHITDLQVCNTSNSLNPGLIQVDQVNLPYILWRFSRASFSVTGLRFLCWAQLVTVFTIVFWRRVGAFPCPLADTSSTCHRTFTEFTPLCVTTINWKIPTLDLTTNPCKELHPTFLKHP